MAPMSFRPRPASARTAASAWLRVTMRVLMAVEPLFLDDELGHAVGQQRYAAVVCVSDHPENMHAPTSVPVEKAAIGTSYAAHGQTAAHRGTSADFGPAEACGP